MKEFLPIKRQEPLTRETRVPKTYNKARALPECNQRTVNDIIEGTYHIMVNYVKALYANLPNEEDRLIVEMDRSKEPSNPTSMYTFMTKHFYFMLECSVMLQFRVEYQFHECPFEEQIMKEMSTFTFRSHSTEVMKMPNYPEFFAEVLRVQPLKFKQIL